MAVDSPAAAAMRELAEQLHAAPIARTTEPAPVFALAPVAARPLPANESVPDPLVGDEHRSLSGAAAALRQRTVRSIDLVEAALSAGDAYDVDLGLFHSRFADRARDAAQRVDDALAAGDDPGLLAGLPLGIKDLLTTLDGPTSAGSLVAPPDDQRDATAVARLRAAGGIVVGKTLTSEYGVGSPDPAKPLPMPRNPWDTARWTGGSSAGSAAGLVAGAFLGALGTDSGGSIRMPSAFCGTTGLKPTYGRVSRAGGFPMGWSTDHIGPMATTARDCALLLSVIAGPDPADPTASRAPVPPYLAGLSGDLSGVRIGVDRLDRVGGAVADPSLESVFAAAVEELSALGADLVEVTLPLYPEIAAASIVVTLSEALTWHRDGFTVRRDDYFANTVATVGLAQEFTAVDYVQAQRVRRAGQEAAAELFEIVDLVVTPTASIAATPYARLDRMFESGEFFAVYAPYWNVVGNPALSVPMGFTADRMPLGLQIIGRPFDEELVLRAGDAYQRRTTWHTARPSPSSI